MSKGAGSVGVSARPDLPTTDSTSGKPRIRASRAFKSSAACVTLTRGTVTGMSSVVPSSSAGMNETPIFGKWYATSASATSVASENACVSGPRVNVTVRNVVTAKVSRNVERQADSDAPNPASAWTGNSPAASMRSAANAHITRLRFGIAHVSSGL